MKNFRVHILEKETLCNLFGEFDYCDKRSNCYSYKWYLRSNNLRNFTNKIRFPLNDEKIEFLRREVLLKLIKENVDLGRRMEVKILHSESRRYNSYYSLRILIYW